MFSVVLFFHFILLEVGCMFCRSLFGPFSFGHCANGVWGNGVMVAGGMERMVCMYGVIV